MSTRTVKITVSRAVEYVDTIEIDEDSYLQWCNGYPDNDYAMREYLDAGDDITDIIHGVIERGTPSFEDSVLVSVTREVQK